MKLGHIEINVQQYGDGRWGFDDYSKGPRKMVRLWSKHKAESRAADVAVCLANGRGDLLQIDPGELAEFRKWKAASKDSPALADACSEFLALKKQKSSRHRQSLTRDLRLFEQFMGETKPIGEIKALDVQHFLNSRDVGQRRKFNLRVSIISLFRWARRMSYLDSERTTEPEKTERIELVPGQVNVLSADELKMLLDNVRPEYLPWLCIAAFAGIRSEEIAPDPASKKSPLKWEDFDWRNRVIVVSSQTAKTKHEREVPILPNLAQWLAPWRNAKGPVMGDCVQPSKHETARLGKLIGRWRHNMLRDSYCSYRTRIVRNMAQTSLEMGNSVQMIQRSYHRRQPVRAAREWFNIRPVKDSKVITFKKAVG
jgi:integrase